VKHQPSNFDLNFLKTNVCLPQAKYLAKTFETLIKTISYDQNQEIDCLEKLHLCPSI